jgi:hypothetical protein
MKNIITLSMLLAYLSIPQIMHALYFSPDELAGGNPALQEALGDDPITFFKVICCPFYTCLGIELLIKAAKNAPSCDRVQTEMTNCCKRMKRARVNFIEAHDKGLLTLLTEKPKQIKMKDE